MSLYTLWKESPQQVRDKQVSQLIAFAGDGRLKDGSRTSVEFRSLLRNVPSELIRKYIDQCLWTKFQDSGLVLQDAVNEVGRRLGFDVIDGRYRGSQTEIAYDGLWKFPSGRQIVVEVKTTDAYRIDLNPVAGYRKRLLKTADILGEEISILIVVGRQDTGDLEAQIRGSQHAWDIRLISAEALLRLLSLKENIEDPRVSEHIRSILIPREYTRVDDIIDLVFSTTEDIEQDIVALLDEEDPAEDGGPAFTPVRFHEACAEKVASHLDIGLIRKSRAYFTTPDDGVGVLCAISKEHGSGSTAKYWFAFHPHQQQWLDVAKTAYVSFGCGGPEKTLLIPYSDFTKWLAGMNQTHRDDGRSYWHVKIYDEDGHLILHRKKGTERLELTGYEIGSRTRSRQR